MSTQKTTPQNEMTARIKLNKIETELDSFFSIYEGVPTDLRSGLIKQASLVGDKLKNWLANNKKG